MKKKFRFEAASDSGAAFLFCDYNPVMLAKIVEFRTLRQMDEYRTENRTIQVRKQLPILIELLEVDSSDDQLVDINLNRMAEWYYYTILKGNQS